MADILTRIAAVIEERQSSDPDKSYVADLHRRGLDAILQKVGEEAIETILASKSHKLEQVVYETADLWFHTLVMLAQHGLSAKDVLQELERRFGTSGLEGKTIQTDAIVQPVDR